MLSYFYIIMPFLVLRKIILTTCGLYGMFVLFLGFTIFFAFLLACLSNLIDLQYSSLDFIVQLRQHTARTVWIITE